VIDMTNEIFEFVVGLYGFMINRHPFLH